MSKKIKVMLNSQGVMNAKAEIDRYKADLIQSCFLFVEALSQEGISVAQYACKDNSLGKYLAFSRRLAPNPHGAEAIVVATNAQGLLSMSWQTQDGIKTVDISPLLMVEFGSGAPADTYPKKVDGVGRGSFPGQTHAFQNMWSWMDLTGEWHTSRGLKPSMPMYKAWAEMVRDIKRIAKSTMKI